MTRSVQSNRQPPIGVPTHGGHAAPSEGVPSSPAVWVDRLIESLSEQSRMLGELLEVASSQADAFAGDDPAAILDVLSRRSRLLAGATDTDETVRDLLSRWRRLIELNTQGMETEQVQIASLIGEVESLRERILEHDHAGQEVLDRRRGEVAEALAGTQRGRNAVHAYGVGEPRGPRFQDREV